jgi:glycosyltransferase involved in cell wall biosynthesis
MKRGGSENVVVWLAAELARRGHDVHVFAAAYSDETYGVRQGQHFRIHEIGGPGWRSSNVPEMWRLAARLRREWASFDLVSPHGYPAYIWVALAKFGYPRFPLSIWYCHEPDRTLYDREFNAHFSFVAHIPEETSVVVAPARGVGSGRGTGLSLAQFLPMPWRQRLVKVMDRRYVRSMDAVLTNSKFTMGRVKAIYGVDLHAQPCPPGIPLPDHVPSVDRLGQDILSIGRLLPSKNVETVLRAMRLLVERGRRVRLRVVGAGPQEGPLRELTRQLNLEEDVLFCGLLDDDQMAAQYASARVLAYLPLDEPFGLVPLEAGAWGVPSLVSNHGGPAETVVDGATGLHADPLSASSVARGLERLLNDERLASSLGQAMRREVLNKFTVEHFVNRFEAATSSLRRRGPPSKAIEEAQSA